MCDDIFEHDKFFKDAQVDDNKRLHTVLKRQIHAFSTLNELQQVGAIEGLKCSVLCVSEPHTSSPGPKWRAQLSLSVCKMGDEVIVESTAESKATAKRCAAEVAVAKLTRCFGFADLTILSNTAAPLSNTQQKITNRQLTQLKDDQEHLKCLADLTRNLTQTRKNIACVSIDLEMYDQDQRILLEVGFSYTTSRRIRLGQPAIESYHWIIKDGLHLHNGKYCQGNKNKFDYGISEAVSSEQLKDRMQSILRHIQDTNEHVYLVGHTVNGDLKWLKQNGINLKEHGMQVCDIGKAYRSAISPDTFVPMVGMERMMTVLQVPYKNLHNGGNDARFNLEVLFVMIEGMIRIALCMKLLEGLVTVTSRGSTQWVQSIDQKDKNY